MSNWNKIEQAYSHAQPLYRHAWALDKAKAMHYGYWDESTHNLTQALRRLNERLAELAQPQKGMYVLDAGCGVGGTALYLVQTHQVRALGISLGEQEIEQARAYAKKANLPEQQLDFQVANYLNIPVADASLDQIWIVESLFHCTFKSNFLAEAKRVLRPGGKLVIADYYEDRAKISQKMQRWLKEWYAGYEVTRLPTWKKFTNLAQKQGFELLEKEDATKAIMPSSKRLARWGRLGLWYLRIFGWLHSRLFPKYPLNKTQIRSTVSQYKALRSRCWAYHLSVWQKAE